MANAYGFSTTKGTGTTDIVTTGVTRSPKNNRLSIFIRANRNGAGGNSFGSVLSKGVGTTQLLRVSWDNTNTRWSFAAPFSTTQPQFTFTGGATTTGVSNDIFLTYDGNSVSNVPVLMVNGTPTTVTTTTAPVGSITWDAGLWSLGNRSGDSARVFDGSVGIVAIWSDIMPRQFGIALARGVHPLDLPDVVRGAERPDLLLVDWNVGLNELISGNRLAITGAKPQTIPKFTRGRPPGGYSAIYSLPARAGSGASASGSLPTVTMSGPAGVASGAASVSGALSTVTLTPVSGLATGAAAASGSMATVALSSPAGSATGAASASANLPNVSVSAAAGVASGDAAATGSFSSVAVTPADGTATGDASASGALPSVAVSGPAGSASTNGSVTASGSLPTITVQPITGHATGGAVHRSPPTCTLRLVVAPTATLSALSVPSTTLSALATPTAHLEAA